MGNHDVDSNMNTGINEISIQNQIQRFKSSIERCESLHMEFWFQLNEDVPS